MIPGGDHGDIFHLPDLGEGLEEAELIEWCVDIGQKVAENDTLAKMETAKALVEVPSPRAGVIAQLHGKPGQAIKVGLPLVTFRAESASPPPSPAPAPAESKPAESKPAEPKPAEKSESRPDAGSVVGQMVPTPGVAGEGPAPAVPAVRRLARELGVDLKTLAGTGIGGRITADDVRAAAAGSASPVQAQPGLASPGLAASAASSSAPPAEPTPDSAPTRIPFRGVRRAIAEHLHHSITHAVHFTVMDEADVTALDALRRKLVAASNEKITLLSFVASAVCRVLSGRMGAPFVRLNSTVDDQTQEILQHRSVHLGIATDTEIGLMVPVIRDADRLGVMELSRQIAQLAKSCRDRSISAQQLTGSTFTLSNYGSLSGRFGTPIINYPEAAILGIGRARDGVVVRDGMLGVGKLLPLSMSADHRVIDGATAAGAMGKIIELLQHPEELLPPGR